LINKGENFVVYSIDGTILWRKNDGFLGSVNEDKLLYYISESKLNCVILTTGEPVWEQDFRFIGKVRNPVTSDNDIIIVCDNRIFVFDKLTGQFKYQVGSTILGEHILINEYYEYYQAMYKNKDSIYITNSNGYVDCVSQE
jgi:outer membrane protein assembly factor BamB